MPSSPLPLRNGVAATRVRLPRTDEWLTVAAYLVHRFPDKSARIRELFAAGEIVDADGTPLSTGSPYAPGASIFVHRDPPDEVSVPFPVEILHRDADIIVVDKPHFLATMPRGRHVVETVLARLRRDLDLPELSPAHRLDRMTAGVLLLTVRPDVRGAYQQLFADRRVTKTYEAIAPISRELELPRTVRSRIVKQRGHLAARSVPGEPNSETGVELIDRSGDLGRYRLRPRTGRTHQLRVHMNQLGIPILGDNYFPTVYDVMPDDFRRPLQLVARSIEFTDPMDGRPRRYASARRLTGWPGV